MQPSDPLESTVQYVGTRELRPLIQFVVSQASVELESWSWRGERRTSDQMSEEEEGEVAEEEGEQSKNLNDEL